jgi:peptidoglycan-N-acetylmuramic acid deacetylase
MMRKSAMFVLISLFAVHLAFPSAAFASIPGGAGDKTYHFGFIKSKNGEAPSFDEEGYKELLVKYGSVILGDTSKKELYLTFNNGYENGNTVKILDILKEKKVPAAFFLTGYYVQYMSQMSGGGLQAELAKMKKGVLSLTGQSGMRYMRPPSGIFNERVLRVGKELGYTNVFWSIAYRDWDTKDQKGWRYAYDNVMGQLHPGAVIMLHAVSDDNTGALGKIIDDARSRGYEFKRLDQLPTPE